MSNLKAKDWVLLAVIAASLVGCIVQFSRRTMLLYFFLPLVLAVFFFVEGRMVKGKLVIVKRLLLFLGAMFVLFCSLVFVITSTPIKGGRDQGSERYLLELDSMQQVAIPSMHGDMDGWLYKQSDEKAPLLIFFNGAGECAAKTVRMVYEDKVLADYFPGYHFLCVDYPGYGLSGGTVSEAAMKRLALDTYDTAIQWDFVDKSGITAVGYSIGTGPAAYLAARRELSSLILLAPYEKYYNNTMRNADRDAASTNKKPMPTVERVFYRLVWGYNVDPFAYAPSIDEPVLILSSLADTTITHEASMKVADRLKNGKVVTLEDVLHEHLLSEPSYQAMNEFLNDG